MSDRRRTSDARLPSAAAVRDALERLLEMAAQQAHARGRAHDAVRYRARATELLPEAAFVWWRLIAYHQERQAWSDAEAAARAGYPPCRTSPFFTGLSPEP